MTDMRPMLQSLLADRFQLKVHTETVNTVAWMWMRSGWTGVPKTSGPKYRGQNPTMAMSAI